MSGDHSWMYNRLSNGYVTDEFKEGVKRFIQFIFLQPNNVDGNKIRCPCSKCHNLKFCIRDEVVLHLYYKGFNEHYTVWTLHGETYSEFGESSEGDINPYKRLVVEGFSLEFQKI